MRYFFVLLLSFLFVAGANNAYGNKHKHRGEPMTEVDLMNSVVSCLSHKDSVGYYYLFPPFDSLWHMVMHNSDHSPEAEQQLANLKEHPQSLIDFDPFYNHNILSRFLKVLSKGEDSGIHWNSIVIQRYELQQEGLTQNLVGYNKIAPERFKGYLFVRDLLGRQTFCITITEIQKIGGYFMGGQVINILEASTIDQFIVKEEKEKKYFDWLATHPIVDTPSVDSAKIAAANQDNLNAASTNDDDNNSKVRKEVIDRRFYEGKFDDEIPVQLYVRYMKDAKAGKTVTYDGLYKFGDQRDFVKLEITLNPEGKWVMEDDPPVGSLELVLKGKIYTGSWTNNDNGTGYDVVLKQTAAPEKKIETLDKILDGGLSGSVKEDTDPEKVKAEQLQKEQQTRKMNEEAGYDAN